VWGKDFDLYPTQIHRTAINARKTHFSFLIGAHRGIGCNTMSVGVAVGTVVGTGVSVGTNGVKSHGTALALQLATCALTCTSIGNQNNMPISTNMAT